MSQHLFPVRFLIIFGQDLPAYCGTFQRLCWKWLHCSFTVWTQWFLALSSRNVPVPSGKKKKHLIAKHGHSVHSADFNGKLLLTPSPTGESFLAGRCIFYGKNRHAVFFLFNDLSAIKIFKSHDRPSFLCHGFVLQGQTNYATLAPVCL